MVLEPKVLTISLIPRPDLRSDISVLSQWASDGRKINSTLLLRKQRYKRRSTLNPLAYSVDLFYASVLQLYDVKIML